MGYEIRRIPRTIDAPPASTVIPGTPVDILPWLAATQAIRTIVDIGAHDGEFAEALYGHFRPVRTYVIEPLPSCRAKLEKRRAAIPHLQILSVGVSDHSGKEVLWENSYGPSSSFLHVARLHTNEFPGTDGETPVRVEVAPLDDLLAGHALESNVLVKIDVQGAEDRVIRGGRKVLGAAHCVLIEVAFAVLYERQPLFEEIHAAMIALGFRLAGFKSQICSPRSRQPLFAHAIYLRSDCPSRAT